ncbi:MAG: hypothetical protein N2Z79_04415, partial [Candidatus Omnitrophica bacterium]|nr:hypothetical protein [Candidatus Omnitrophota bacterium]
MLNTFFLLYISLIFILFLGGALFIYLNRVKQLKEELERLKKELYEMDEQAKLILSTDMELNKTQEELNKKISGLYALQRISQSIINALEEKEIFSRIEPNYLEEMGFSKACAFIYRRDSFLNYFNFGYFPEDLELIKSYLEKNSLKLLEWIKRQKVFSSLDSNEAEEINSIFKVLAFVFVPIFIEETRGFLLVGIDRQDIALTEGDKELMTILGTQITQTLK